MTRSEASIQRSHQRILQRVRNLEKVCRDLKEEIGTLERRMAVQTAYIATGVEGSETV